MLGRVLQALRVRQSGIQRVAYKRRPHLYPGPQRGVVVRVIAADVEDEQRRASPPQVICDVLLARGGIVRAPVLQRGSAVTNVSRWVPTPARTNMATGAAVKLVNDGLDPPPSDIEDLDGDLVVVEFLELDLNRPVIMGSLEHQRGRRSAITKYPTVPVTEGAGYEPRRHSEVGERFVAHQGTTGRIDRGGNVRLDLRRAGVANDDRTYDVPNETAGQLDIALRGGREVIIRNEAGEPIFRVVAQADGTVLMRAGKTTGERLLLAGPTIAHMNGVEESINEIGFRVTAMWQVFAATLVAASDANAPLPMEVPPIGVLLADPNITDEVAGALQQSWGFEAIELAGDVAGTLKAAFARVSARVLGG